MEVSKNNKGCKIQFIFAMRWHFSDSNKTITGTDAFANIDIDIVLSPQEDYFYLGRLLVKAYTITLDKVQLYIMEKDTLVNL